MPYSAKSLVANYKFVTKTISETYRLDLEDIKPVDSVEVLERVKMYIHIVVNVFIQFRIPACCICRMTKAVV